MSTDEGTPKAKDAKTPDDARSDKADPKSQQLPPVKNDPRDEPGDVGSPHKGQAGHAGSGDDAELQSIGQSQSDRAAGKSS